MSQPAFLKRTQLLSIIFPAMRSPQFIAGKPALMIQLCNPL
jgi:hypothetical protein